MILRRRFLQVGARRVHYFRAGDGPPVVLVHSSPANARLLRKEIEHLARDYTVFAFDTPGFGLSQPLTMDEMIVADLADALAETLAAIGMPRCPVFGTHTGAAIALELGVRHSGRVTGLVLDGVPAFTEPECDHFFRDYFRTLPIDDLGGHYAMTWTRFRDQSIWFPWCEREPGNLNDYDLSPPHSTHLWVSMFFEAAETYAPAYRAASYYGDRAIAAAAELAVPAIFTAVDTDMLYPHLDRLPPLKAGQEIRRIGPSYERKRALIAEGFARFGDVPDAPVQDTPCFGAGRQFFDGLEGQVHIRFGGKRSAPALLLIHDAPGSSEQLEALIAALGAHFCVIAPDLPGHGESDPVGAPDIAAFGAEAVALLDRLGIASAVAFGIGFGASVAVEIAARVSAVVVSGLLLPDAAERADHQASYAPPIAIEADGSHWYRTWLMLRDSQVYWPWYDRSLGALRRVEADFSARPLHRWTMDVMRARESYGDLIHAALAHDAGAALDVVAAPLFIVDDPAVPSSAHHARAVARRPDAPVLDGADPETLAASLARRLLGLELKV